MLRHTKLHQRISGYSAMIYTAGSGDVNHHLYSGIVDTARHIEHQHYRDRQPVEYNIKRAANSAVGDFILGANGRMYCIILVANQQVNANAIPSGNRELMYISRICGYSLIFTILRKNYFYLYMILKDKNIFGRSCSVE